MTYVHREHIDHPSAWTSRSIGGKQGLVYHLKPRHLDAFDVILAVLILGVLVHRIVDRFESMDVSRLSKLKG